jgi:Fe/S biogenesis protein NfuA
MSVDTAQPVLRLTDEARARVLEVRGQEPNPDQLALCVEVGGVERGAWAYEMYLQPLEEVGPDDLVEEHEGLSVVVPGASVPHLRGAELDVNRNLLEPDGMVIRNPNRPPAPADAASPAMAMPALELSGDVAQRVTQVLDQQVNPGIAAHGGRAELVQVEGDVAYVSMSGGCQGCAMSAATLRQGIETAIRHHVPEIAQVVDVTDHASGANPFYASQ